MPGEGIAIIVATHGRPEPLAAMMRSVYVSRDPRDREVELVVVANASPRSAAVARTVGAEAPPWLRIVVLDEPQAGKCRALNHGIAASRGALLAFTDDDVVVEGGYLEGLAEAFDDPAVDAVQGRVTVAPPQPRPPWWGRHCEALMASTIYLDQRPAEAPLDDLNGCNMAVRRAVCQPFNEFIGPGTHDFPSGEDVEWSMRLVSAGARLRYCPKMSVRHMLSPARRTLASLLDRAFAAGRLEGACEAHTAVAHRLLRLAIDGARLGQSLLSADLVGAAERGFALARGLGALRGYALRNAFRRVCAAPRRPWQAKPGGGV